MNLDEVKRATSLDKTWQKAIEYMCTGKWYNLKHLEDVGLLELQTIRNVQVELAVYSDNVLPRGGRLVLTKTLRGRAVAISNEGHQGISRTKRCTAQKYVSWDEWLKLWKRSKVCLPCQSVTVEPSRIEPFKMSDMPNEPWENRSVGLCGPLPSEDYLFVFTDEFSRYQVVVVMRSTAKRANAQFLFLTNNFRIRNTQSY